MTGKGFVYSDGIFAPREKFSSRGFDVSFSKEKGIFETMRSYGGCIFALERHLKRLARGCALLGIKPPAEKELKAAVLGVLKINRLQNARIRLAIIIRARRLHVFARARSVSSHGRGYCVTVIHNPRRKASILNRIKLCRRDFYEHLYQKAVRQGYQEALFLNPQSYVVEGTRTNVFMAVDGVLWTPALVVGCLPGVTRSIVIEQARQAGLIVRQKRIHVKDLENAQEVFLTNAVIGIMPVLKLDGRIIGGGKPGIMTRQLIKRYQKLIHRKTATATSARVFLEKECKRG